MNKQVYSVEKIFGLRPKPYYEEFSNYGETKTVLKESEKPVVITKHDDSVGIPKYLAIIENKYYQDNNNEDEDETKKEIKIQSNYMTQFYIGSLSIVGLYVFFRYMYKMK